MKYIIRPKYMNSINKFIDKPVIKILSGMRRVGKSTILKTIKNDILKDVPDENKLFLNFESTDLFHLKDYMDLMNYLKPFIEKAEGKLYFFFDEIQMIAGWEKLINGLRNDYDSDIYITGSNSTLISGNLSTLLAGRYVEFEIQPFTFSEFKELFSSKDLSNELLFREFIKLGGMPFLKYFDLEEEPSYKYLNDVYNTVLVKDVLEYNKIRDVDIFSRILSYITENIGHTFSANSIKKFLKSENRTISVDTILNYLSYCQEAFIIKKIPRFDTAGKNILKVEEKYYLTDHGFRAAKGFSNTKDIERILENIVCIELISRGYEVNIGKVYHKEIDFIAKKDGKIEYYQVSYILASEETRNREFNVYNDITDHYPKNVLSMDHLDFSRDGIIHKNIIEFLLEG